MKLKFLKDIKKSGSPCKEYEGQKYYIDTGNVNNDIIIGKELYSYKDKPSRANIVVETGDVLFAKMQNSIKVICINETNKNYIYSTGFYCLKDKRILPEYLKYYFLSKEFNIKKDNLCQGATMKALNDNGLEQIEIEVPPISEQKRIVAIIDSLYSIIKLKNKQLNLLNELIKSRFIELFGDPKTNPNRWPISRLSEFCDLQNGYAFKSDDYLTNSTVLNCRMSNIRPDGGFDAEYHPKYLPDMFWEKYKDYRLLNGDVIIAMTDMASDPKILGVPTIVRTNGKKFLLNQRVGKLTFFDNTAINNVYLMFVLSQKHIRQQLVKSAGGSTQINVGKPAVLGVEFFVPPMKLQEQFAAFVEQTDKSKSVCLEKIEKYTELYNKLMNDYFGG